MPRALDLQTFDAIGSAFKKIGFQFVAVDVEGYRTGSLNEILTTLQVPGR
jgi:uncharacterized protein